MLIQGDCLEELKRFEDNSFTTVATDPPYGIKIAGKSWDKALPNPEVWKEVHRVCKPGAFMTVCASQKTLHRVTCHIEDAGFEIRDIICWFHNRHKGSGHNLKCQIKGWENYGSSLTGCWDPILLCQKTSEGTKIENVAKWGCGSLRLDLFGDVHFKESIRVKSRKKPHVNRAQKGRFPQNIVVSEDAEKVFSELGCYHCYNCFYSSVYDPSKHDGLEFFNEKVITNSVNSQGVQKVLNFHPTVKPLSLMEHLIKLTTPPVNARVLDPFCGSGTTLVACRKMCYDFVGIDLSAEYLDIADARVQHETNLFNYQDKVVYVKKNST